MSTAYSPHRYARRVGFGSTAKRGTIDGSGDSEVKVININMDQPSMTPCADDDSPSAIRQKERALSKPGTASKGFGSSSSSSSSSDSTPAASEVKGVRSAAKKKV